jgi:hypothetical protein
MRFSKITDENLRFRGSGRHYHRAANSAGKDWEAWINGVSTKQVKSRNWPQILGVTAVVLALLGLIIGLIIELG